MSLRQQVNTTVHVSLYYSAVVAVFYLAPSFVYYSSKNYCKLRVFILQHCLYLRLQCTSYEVLTKSRMFVRLFRFAENMKFLLFRAGSVVF